MELDSYNIIRIIYFDLVQETWEYITYRRKGWMYKRAFVLFVLPIYNWITVWMVYSCRETIRKLRDAAPYFDWRFQLSLRSVLRSALRPMLRFVASVSTSTGASVCCFSQYFNRCFGLLLQSVLRPVPQSALRPVPQSALRPMLRFVASVSASAFGRGAHWTPAPFQNQTTSLQL